MKKFLQKLKSNKGATGADIVVALSVLSVAMVVVSVIFVNMQNLNKQVNRTAGATRIAVNLIESMRAAGSPDVTTTAGNNTIYEAIEKTVTNKSDVATARTTIKAATNKTVSRTFTGGQTITLGTVSYTVPAGYNITVTFQSWPATNTKNIDSVAKLTFDVSYNVGKQTKHVTISTGICRQTKTTLTNAEPT